MHVFRSMIIDASIDETWAALRAFDGVVNWNPGVSEAVLESGQPTATSTIRCLSTPDGQVFRETLLAHSDAEHFYSYDILESPLPVSDYVSTHRLLPITSTNQTLSIWESRFECRPQDVEEMERVVGDVIYIGGMSGLNAYLREQSNG
ncbi:MAG: SRPBCC family protein [Pseudomonadota bacterium]